MKFQLAFFLSLGLTMFLKRFTIPELRSKEGVPFTGGFAIMIPFYVFSNGIMDHWLLLACTAMFCLGLVDDWLVLNWKWKLSWQLAICMLFVVVSDFNLGWFGNWFDYLLSLFWLVGITNAFNLLDNIDGLCAGTVVIVGGFLLIMTGGTGILIMIGAVLGFWVFNYKDAKIWMGDSGSLLLGFFMAANVGEREDPGICLLLLALPILDTSFVTIMRIKAGKKPWIGGKDHLSHSLVKLGLNEFQAVMVLWGFALMTSLLAYWLIYR